MAKFDINIDILPISSIQHKKKKRILLTLSLFYLFAKKELTSAGIFNIRINKLIRTIEPI